MDQNLVNRGIIGDDEDEVSSQLSQLIMDDKGSLVDLVQMMGDYLTKEDQKQRASATGLLSKVMGRLSKDKLSKQQIRVVIGFLCDRLEDDSSLQQVADGLQAVIQMTNASVLDIDSVLDPLGEIQMKKHTQNVRYSVYRVLDALKGVCKNKQKFIGLYIELTTGEKDPRNLLISFSISHYILSNLQSDVKDHIEDMFDVTFCYFPITFEPPKDDPYGITSQDLKQALRKSIAANGLFAKDAFQGLVEKLNSSVESVKIDTFETIIACLENYSAEQIQSEWVDLWDGIKYEVLHGEEDNQLPLTILKLLGTKVGQEYYHAVIKETEDKLKDPAGKFALPAAKLVTSVAQSSPEAFEEMKKFVPMVLEKFEGGTVAEQRGVVQILSLYLAASTSSSPSGRSVVQDLGYKDQIMTVMARALGNKPEISLRKLAIQGFTVICQLQTYEKNEVGLIVQYLNDAALGDDNEELSDAALVALSKIADIYPDIIIEITFPAFLSQLPDSAEFQSGVNRFESGGNSKSIDFILSALASVSVSPQVFETLKTRLLFKLDGDHSGSYRYPLAIVSTLLAVVQRIDTQNTDLFVPLLTKVVQNKSLQHDAVVDATASVAEHLVSKMPSEQQETWAAPKVIELFAGDSAQLVNVFAEPTSLAQLFTLSIAPIKSKKSGSGSDYLIGDGAGLIECCKKMLNQTQNVFQRGAYLRLIALCSNKWTSPSELRSPVTVAAARDSNDLEIAAWYAKGLILRNDPKGYEICGEVLDLLNGEPHQAAQASKVFGVLVCDDPVLNKQNCIVRLLSKQRLFAFALPKLVSNQDANNLTALASLLRYTPSKIIVPELEIFLPLLLESISLSSNSRVQEAAIDTIYATLSESASLLAERIDSIVPKLLGARGGATGASSVGVRVAALKCLAALPSTLPRPVLEPYRLRVINELSTSLQDPKRSVRREAVICRQQYYEM